MHIVGDIEQGRAVKSLAGLNAKWKAKSVTVPTVKTPAPPAESKVYFYDVPGAVQSVSIRFRRLPRPIRTTIRPS